MSRYNRVSCWAILAFIVFLCGLILYCSGYATNYWEQSETSKKTVAIGIGLWRYEDCSGGNSCTDYTYNYVPTAYRSDSYVAVQALSSIVLILLGIILVLYLIYLIAGRCREPAVAVGILCLCLLAVFLAIITMIVWVAQIPTNFYAGYSFGMFVIGYMLVLLAGLLMIPDIRTNRRTREIKVKPNRREYDDDGLRKNYERYEKRQKEKPRDYEEVRREKYDRDTGRYERNLKPSKEADDTNYYYNPNRKPYVRSPPPRYSAAIPETKRDLNLGTPVPRPHRF